MTAPAPTGPTPNAMPGAAQAAAAQVAPGQATPPPDPANAAATAAAAAQADPAAAAPAGEPAGGDDKTPPWGNDFTPERAWETIKTQRAEESRLREENNGLRTKYTEAEPILAEHERLRRASMEEQDRLREDLNTKGTELTAATTRADAWRSMAMLAKVEALSAGKFVNTEDVLLHLGDLSQYATDDAIDEAKLTTQLTELATKKPYLLAPVGPQGFTPNRAQGQAGNGAPLTAAQVAAQAESQGDLKAATSAKAGQLINLAALSGGTT